MLRVAALLVTLCMPALALAQGTITQRESKHTVEETAARLVKALEAKGVKVAARIDHAAGAKAVGLELPPTQVILFGNPKLGTPLMQANPHMGIDLPMRMLVWQDKVGKVWVGYTPPATLQARHGIKGEANVALLRTMNEVLEAFAKAAAGAE